LNQNNTVLAIESLQYHYPDGHRALNGINLQVAPHEKIALVGPNGAGKSTLLMHLNGILTLESGEIRVCGQPLQTDTIKHIRSIVGLVFQQPDDQLFSPTVFEDVAYGPIYQGLPVEEIDRRVRTALQAVGMESYIQRVPYHLSIGEKKRIAVATVLSMQPEILALDEPSAGLDPRARRTLIELLKALPYTMLVATHDLNLVRELCPRTVLMDSGQIVADDVTPAVLNNASLLEKYGLE
jgi:cobalt/nickel transport system ATP-binding protein